MKLHSFLAFSFSAIAAVAQHDCFTSAAAGTSLGNIQDTIYPAATIGFAFPFAGTTYANVHVSDHGLVFLSNNGTPTPPVATPFVYTPSLANFSVGNPIIACMWSDTIGGGTNSGVFVSSSATQCRIEWRNMRSFGIPSPIFSLAVTLFPSGQIDFEYDRSVTNNSTFGGVSDNGIVGVYAGGVLPASTDLSVAGVTGNNTLYENFVVANTFDMQNTHLSLFPTSPGWAWVTVGTAGCATTANYGAGCGAPALSQTATGLPTVGNSTFALTASNIPSLVPIAFTFFGSLPVNPGLPLDGLGLTGCAGYTNADLGSFTFTPISGSGSLTVPIPSNPALVDIALSAQSLAFSLVNAANLITSNGTQFTIGY